MAIAPTGAIYKALEFDSISSRNYGVYITGEAVYNAPERDVQMITIPGRSGSFALDNGRFQNIEVSYPAGIFTETEADFRDAISEFRNFLCSRKGYVRLQDEYNPNEYRMAVYKSGLEVDPAQLRAGEFTITFDCKPQRWLTDGETPIDIGVWGDTDTETDSIVEVDNPDGILAIKDLTADIEPIQSFNGYDKPWVGGAGKNKCPKASADESYIAGLTMSVATNGEITLNGTTTATNYIRGEFDTPLAEGNYTFASFNPVANSSLQLSLRDSSMNPAGGWHTLNAVNKTNSFTSDAGKTAYYWQLQINNGVSLSNFKFNPMLVVGSTAPTTFEPYENICPISGHTDVVVTVADDYDNPSVSDTYTTALGTTVYGGTLDVTTGVLTVTHARMDLGSPVSGSWNYATDNTYNVFYLNKEQLPALPRYTGGVITSLSDSFNAIANTTFPIFANGANNNNCLTITSEGTVQRILIRCDLYTSAASFQTAMSGHYVVYELATPTTTTLTPQQIDLLLGQNNIWSDTGDVTVEYGQDPNKLINPTLFESTPLLEVEGIGNLTINGKNISIENVPLGSVSVYSGASSSSSTSNSIHLWFQMDLSRLNTGDAITLSGVQAKNAYSIVSIWDSTNTITQLNLSNITNMASSTKGITGARTGYVNYSPIPFTFYKGTSATSVSSSIDVYGQIMGSSLTTHDETRTYTYYAQYDGNDRIDLYFNKTNGSPAKRFDITTQAIIPEIMGDSTISTLPTPVYIDLDIGEAYGEYSGVISSVNNAVILPANLPTLAPGSNTITFDNTITDLKVVPRWWKV